jgi:hypothetical protein
MKKVVLLGDSIRLIGYGKPVAERLSGDFQVWQPEGNCRFAKHTLRGLWDWKHEIAGADIIHWNNGLWDVCDLFGDGPFTPLDIYVQEMLRLAELLKKRTRVLIFATTTPVRPENPHNRNADIAAYNAALVPRLQELGVQINDLFTPLVADVERYIRADDLIHLTEEGIALCAELVERAICNAASDLAGETKTVAPMTPGRAGAPS